MRSVINTRTASASSARIRASSSLNWSSERIDQSMIFVNHSRPVTVQVVIDGDNAGFPNGRRLGDDVVDIVRMKDAAPIKCDCFIVAAAKKGHIGAVHEQPLTVKLGYPHWDGG